MVSQHGWTAEWKSHPFMWPVWGRWLICLVLWMTWVSPFNNVLPIWPTGLQAIQIPMERWTRCPSWDSVYLTGVARLFAYNAETIHLIKVINETVSHLIIYICPSMNEKICYLCHVFSYINRKTLIREVFVWSLNYPKVEILEPLQSAVRISHISLHVMIGKPLIWMHFKA